MVGRRETRHEADAFKARLEGRSAAERKHLLAEHRAYLAGERDDDADFGDSPAAEQPAANGLQGRVPRPVGTPRRAPMGKMAAYLALLEKEKAGEDAESNEKQAGRPGSHAKPLSKAAQKRREKEEKAAQEMRAKARAAAAAAKKNLAQMKERRRLELEEQRGASARAAAQDRLESAPPHQKKTRTARGAAGKKKRRVSPHIPAQVDDDRESISSSGDSVSASNASPVYLSEGSSHSAARALDMDVQDNISICVDQEAEPANATEDVHVESAFADSGMTSEVEGDSSDSESWYVEVRDGVLESADEDEYEGDEVEGESGDQESDDDRLDGSSLIAREKKKAYKALAASRLKAATAKLPRDWAGTVGDWPALTKAEMAVLAQDTKALRKLRADGWEFGSDTDRDAAYPNLYSGECGPVEEVLTKADSPLDLFFFFMPRSLWSRIAYESNRYYHQHLNERVDKMFKKQQDAGKEVSREEVMDAETKKHKEIKGFEIVRCIGLLVARMLCPHSRRLADNWATTTTGAVPGGTFGRYMSKARFGRIMQNLHFSNNTDPRAGTDRAWKVRPVIDKLQETFRAGYHLPAVLSFDEAVIPSRGRHNVTRQYLKDKPHKWGTKMFMTCCAETSYCVRLEVFCGKDQHSNELGGASPHKFSADPNSGPAAVVRNLHEVLPPPVDGVYHAVVTDRFYTSVQLALQLLSRNVYSIGTIQPNRAGFPKEVTTKAKTRPRGVARGSTTIGVAKAVPALKALLWWDRKPVNLLATGGSIEQKTCERRLPGGKKVIVPCPSVMRDYQRWMGGVDIHDQLRLLRYSVQLSVVFRKYYKTVFLGLVDMAIVNAYIVFREARKLRNEGPADHAKFMRMLQAQLLEVTARDFADVTMSPAPPTPSTEPRPISSEHKLTVFPDWDKVVVTANGEKKKGRKRPQHQCKVCSLRKRSKKERCSSRFYCAGRSKDDARIYLCDRVRPKHYPGNALNCFQIWHSKWNNGTERPRPLIGRDIQMRGLGKKRRRPSASEEEKDGEVEEEDESE